MHHGSGVSNGGLNRPAAAAALPARNDERSLTFSSIAFSREASMLDSAVLAGLHYHHHHHASPSGACCNALCKLSCCCFLYSASLRPLFISFDYTHWSRKLWWIWMVVCQLLVFRFPFQLVTWLIVCTLAGVVVLSLVWAAAARGFHRGLGLIQLALWIPLSIYIIARLAGVDQDGLDKPLDQNHDLYEYAILEVVTLGISCVWSFFDVLGWLRGGMHARVWGHAAVAEALRAGVARAELDGHSADFYHPVLDGPPPLIEGGFAFPPSSSGQASPTYSEFMDEEGQAIPVSPSTLLGRHCPPAGAAEAPMSNSNNAGGGVYPSVLPTAHVTASIVNGNSATGRVSDGGFTG
jgi:hypothetical protein